MTEQNRDNEKVKSIKHTKKKRVFSFTLIIIATILCLFLWRSFFYKSVDEQLAEIEASRAIPASENAAIYYKNFFADQKNIAIIDELRSYAQSSNYEPWLSSNNPQAAAILQKHKSVLNEFIDISKIHEARFSFDLYDFLNNRISIYLRDMTFILSWAGANDLGDGRIDEAIGKYVSQIRIGHHLIQQPIRVHKQVGVAIEAVGLGNMRDLAMHDNLTKEQLQFLDTIVSETQQFIVQDKELEERISRLLPAVQTQNQSFLSMIEDWFANLRSRKQIEDRWQILLLRRISIQRAGRIMIALRLYQIKNSRWPDTLADIESSLPKENFTDAINNSSFVYKLNGDSFVLYSKGPDNTDDNNRKGSDDVIFWSPPTSQTIEKQASDPNEESKE